MFLESRLRGKEKSLRNIILAQIKLHLQDADLEVEKLIRLEQSDIETKGIGKFYEEIVAGINYDFVKDNETVFSGAFELHTMPWSYHLMKRVTPSVMNTVAEDISRRFNISDKPVKVYRDLGSGHSLNTYRIRPDFSMEILSRPQRTHVGF